MNVSDVRFVQSLYPRVKPSDKVIKAYADALDKLPPIVIARDGILVDGYHRWQAHKRAGIETIEAESLGNLADDEILRESYRRNAKHGFQLAPTDKKRAANHIFRTLAHLERDERYQIIASDLGLTLKVASDYCKESRQDEDKERNERIWDLWLNCWTQQQIADEVGLNQPAVKAVLSKIHDACDFDKTPEKPQSFDVWSGISGEGKDYFGALPEVIMQNLLHFYTEPGNIVFDPFCGSGTTIEVAKTMGRRVFASDLVSAEKYPMLPIHTHDIASGWPENAPNKVDLIFLDPPYWKQAAGKYSGNGSCLGNIYNYEDFLGVMARILKLCKSKLREGGRVAYIIGPTEDTETGTVVDHATDFVVAARNARLRVERRIIVPYSTQQATGAQVNWARNNRRMLKLYRDLVVLQK